MPISTPLTLYPPRVQLGCDTLKCVNACRPHLYDCGLDTLRALARFPSRPRGQAVAVLAQHYAPSSRSRQRRLSACRDHLPLVLGERSEKMQHQPVGMRVVHGDEFDACLH